MPQTRNRELVSAALIAALMAGTAWFTASVQPVPFSVQTFFVVLAALVLSPPWAASSMAVYVTLGAVGLPVFAGGKGGVAVILGPTGGYLIGFIVGALAGALVREALERRKVRHAVADALAALAVMVVVYSLGVLQLSIVAGIGLGAAVLAGLVPFIAGDLVKAAVAVAAASLIRRARGARA